MKKTMSVPTDMMPNMNTLPTFDTKPRLDALESMMQETTSEKNPKRRE